MKTPDYASQWQHAMNEKTAVGNPYRDQPEAALSYDRSEMIWADGFTRASEFWVDPQDTILDIGSGPGILAVPLAKRVRRVTAVEPSETMIKLMLAHAKEHEIHNLETIHCRWEDVDAAELGKYDYVIASYSLNMPDLEAALKKMNAVAKKCVLLYWFCGIASWEQIKIDLYPTIYGKQFVPQPKSDLIYGMLAEMGISADIRALHGTSFDRDFPDMAAAILNMRSRLGVSGSRWDKCFAEYVERNFRRLDGSGWRYVDRTHYVRIGWTPCC